MEVIQLSYGAFWQKYQQDLGHYFRYLYNIFNFIKEHEIKDKPLYSNIVRAQLSDKELIVLFYDCLSQSQAEVFKPLAEEFSIFDKISFHQLLNTNHVELYRPEAFGETESLNP